MFNPFKRKVEVAPSVPTVAPSLVPPRDHTPIAPSKLPGLRTKLLVKLRYHEDSMETARTAQRVHDLTMHQTIAESIRSLIDDLS